MVILMVKAIQAGPKDYVALLNGEADPMETPEPKSDTPQSPEGYGDDSSGGKPAPAE